jgi:hypothetical protein
MQICKGTVIITLEINHQYSLLHSPLTFQALTDALILILAAWGGMAREERKETDTPTAYSITSECITH